jgi:hypothetical protein
VSALFQATLGGLHMPDSSIGFEPIGRAVRLLLSRDLEDELARQESKWRDADLHLQSLGFDPGVGQVDLEPIPNGHLHEGSHESLLEATASAFPNVSMMAYQHVPTVANLFDQLYTYDVTLYVETMVKSGPVAPGTEVAHETIVHRRIQRTTEAVHNVIKGDATLLGTVLPQQAPCRGWIGRVSWIKNDGAGETGQRVLWHGSRLQYTLQRASTRGSS